MTALRNNAHRVMLVLSVIIIMALVSACGGDASAGDGSVRSSDDHYRSEFNDTWDDYIADAERNRGFVLNYVDNFPELDFIESEFDVLVNVAWLCAEVDYNGAMTVIAINRLAAEIYPDFVDDLVPLAEAAGSYVCSDVIGDYSVDPYVDAYWGY